MLKLILCVIIVAILAAFGLTLILDLYRHRNSLNDDPGSPLLCGALGAIVCFIGTFGVSDFVMNTLLFKKFKLVEDQKLAGALVTVCCLPMGFLAVSHLLSAPVDMKLIALCLALQSLGAIVGVRIMSGFNGAMIKKIIGVAMLASAIFLLIRLIGVDSSGTLTSFSLPQMALVGACAFVLGMLNMMGMGTKAPWMSLLMTMGLASNCVLPVVMVCCTTSTTVGAIQYVRKGIYPRKLAFYYAIFGLLGTCAGFLFVSGLNQTVLQVIMLAITVYTGITLLVPKKNS